MKRILMMLTVALVMAAVMMVSVLPAFAQAQGPHEGRGPEVAAQHEQTPGQPPPFGGQEPAAVGHACKGLNTAPGAPFFCP